jgi:pilus assembly protein FimV
MEDAGELDIDFEDAGPDGAVSDIIDLGAESGQVLVPEAAAALDFDMGDEEALDLDVSITREMPQSTVETPTMDASLSDDTADLPEAESSETVETPTIEQQFATLEATGELSAIADSEATELASLDDLDDPGSSIPTDATAEIDLDDLGLDLAGLDDTQVAADDDGDGPQISDLEDTTESQTLKIDESLAATGRNLAVDEGDALAATGKNLSVDIGEDTDATGVQEALDATGELPGLEEATGKNLALPEEDTDVGIDTSLLDATGQTQILSEDMAVETASDVGASLSDEEKTTLANPLDDDDEATDQFTSDAATMLAPLDDDESTLLTDDSDFDFAKTEALPKDVFTGNMAMDDSGETPGLAGSTDMDLDLDDLTAALKISEVGDTVNQMRDDATVEQPRVKRDDVDLDVGDSGMDADTGETQALAPEDLSGDLHDARTMTEVGTKLDLARAYVDMGDPGGARSILEEVLDEGDEAQRQQAQQLLDSIPS